MPSEAAASLPRSRPNTRSSIRQSLTLASMGKALADVMHKENKDGAGEKEKEKQTRKTKDAASRRSTAAVVPAPAQTATDRPASSGRRVRDPSPDIKTITRASKRLSASAVPKASALVSSDDQSSSPAGHSPKRGVTRSSSLRPRNSVANSGLPKYRPRSAVFIETVNVKSPPSPPVRAGVRRRLSSSEEEKEEIGKQLFALDIPKSEKSGRAISPLPHKGALKVNLTGAINVRPATPEKKTKPSTPTPQESPSRRQSSPTRLPVSHNKASKTANKLSSSVGHSAQRPPSSSSASSSSSSKTPYSPTTPTVGQRIAERSGGSARLKISQGPSPLRTVHSGQESPLANATARRRLHNSSPSPSPSPARLMPPYATSSLLSTPGPIILTPNSSMDSMEASDVEFMLSAIASPGAPTPALPKFRTIRPSDNDESPHTPPRGLPSLPNRANMSYLSPAPPTAEGSPFLRPRVHGGPTERGSILSWEQLAQHSRTMGQEDIDHMLADVDSPFRSIPASPAPSNLSDIPESPNLSALPSPTGYGSISQVLLPDVTPSPAVFNAHLRFDEMAVETPPGDSSNAMMLRLQLAAAESSGNEQRLRIEALEAQLKSATEARLRDTEELAAQISVLEEQVQCNLRPDEQLQHYVATLEQQLAHAQVARDQAVDAALKQAQVNAVKAQTESLKRQQARWTVASAAQGATNAWSSVKCHAENELEHVRASQDMLAVLLAGLGHMTGLS